MIEKAEAKDFKECIRLIKFALSDLTFVLSGVDSEDEASGILETFFRGTDNRLSHQNCYIYKKDGKIAAAMIVYEGAKGESLDKKLNQNLANLGHKYRVQKECDECDFYIDSIAVSEEFRHQGIASELINFAYNLAKSRNLPLSLLADEDNKPAISLYKKLGFGVKDERLLYDHKYFYMIKS